MTPYSLGATMYVPATNKDLAKVISGEKFPGIDSLVICTEDSISSSEVPKAISNISDALKEINKKGKRARPYVFIRPRNISVAELITTSINLKNIDGFVIPKFNLSNAVAWNEVMDKNDLFFMPTLEDKDVFDHDKMKMMAELISGEMRKKIIMVRIGGNDLFSCLGLRRVKGLTIYDTPLGATLKNLSLLFLPKGIMLSSPVVEHIDDTETLIKELKIDVAHGFVSKTAIHPSQIELINREFRVDEKTLKEANEIISSNQAVFKLNGSMAEPATHTNWALNIKEKAASIGVREESVSKPNVVAIVNS